jgi:hypothetical protein
MAPGTGKPGRKAEKTRRVKPVCPLVQVSELDMTIVTTVKQSGMDLP